MDYKNKTYFDLRYNDYYTISEVIKEDGFTFFMLDYQTKKHLSKRENAAFVTYHIEQGQHLLKQQ